MVIAVNFPIEAIGKKKPEKSGLQICLISYILHIIIINNK